MRWSPVTGQPLAQDPYGFMVFTAPSAGVDQFLRLRRRGNRAGGAESVTPPAARGAELGDVTLAGLEARLKSRRGLVALWVSATAAAALVALLMQRGGVPRAGRCCPHA